MNLMKKILFLTCLISGIGLSAMVDNEEEAIERIEKEADLSQESTWLGAKIRPEPYYMPDGSIKVGANIGNCGGIKVTTIQRSQLSPDTQELLKQGELWVKARLFSATDTPASNEFIGKMRVPEGGFTAAYDWAGRRPSAHYRVYFYVLSYPMGGQGARIEIPVDAQQVIQFKTLTHNSSCVLPSFISGTGSYGPLQMNKGGVLQF